jgi:hypothetical protein
MEILATQVLGIYADAAISSAAVEHSMRCRVKTREDGRVGWSARNLGYFAGYYDHWRRASYVERLYRCAHPVFGKIAANGPTRSQGWPLKLGAAISIHATEPQ